MVNRPLAKHRPVGPFMDIDMSRGTGEKVQLGVHGTTMPNKPKSALNVLFVLDSHVATLPRTVESSTFKEKVYDKVSGHPRISYERSGRTSAKPFNNQAVVVSLRGDSLPVQDSQLHKIANVIERTLSTESHSVGIRTIIMDTQ